MTEAQAIERYLGPLRELAQAVLSGLTEVCRSAEAA